MNIELLYVLIAILIWTVGYCHTGRFVRPKWKIPGKFIFYVSISFLLANWVGHWSFLFIIGHPLIGLLFHIKVCKANNIDWVTCHPQEKYLQLQEQWAKGDFSKSKKQ